jgi:GNAT superfamily N-acetyltransferase
MAFDAALALRMITNARLRNAQGWGTYRDLRGALALTSDAPIASLNCLNSFTTDERNIESLLEIGFGLLRAFDRDPAAEVTPLDRPRTLNERLARRRMTVTGRRSWMAFGGKGGEIRTNGDVEVRIADPEQARAFATVHGGSQAWARRLSLASTVEGMLDEANTFYLAYLEGAPAGTLHLLRDGTTAGIYAVTTVRAHRRKGIGSMLTARAIADARAAGCDVVCLSTDAGGYAERLYTELGFVTAFESQVWQPAT